MSTTKFYDDLVKNMPAGLDRAIVQTLKFHIGKSKAIKKADFLKAIGALGYKPHERQLRDMIAEMRLSGWMIGSLSAEGYYFCETRAEYEEFRAELEARRAALSATLSALDSVARQRWGDAVQVGLL